MFRNIIRRIFCVFLSITTVSMSIVPFSFANAQSGSFDAEWREICAIHDCDFKVSTPRDKWRLVDSDLHFQISGLRSVSSDEARSYFEGDAWMSTGDISAGIARSQNDSASLMLGKLPSSQDFPTWIVAKYFAESKELTIQAIRLNRTFYADDMNQPQKFEITSAFYTPHHGGYHVARGSFLPHSRMNSSATLRGVDPFTSFASSDRTDPTFYNIGGAAAEVAVGLAMEHFRSSHGIWIDAKTRVNQWVHVKKRWYGRKTYINTEGFARPSFSLILPHQMSPALGSDAPAVYAVTCPAGDGQCTTPEEIAFSGISKVLLSDDQINEIEQKVYGTHTRIRRSYATLISMMSLAAGAWAIGAFMANTAAWSYVLGFGTAPTAASVLVGGAAASGGAIAAISGAAGGVILYQLKKDSEQQSNWTSDPGDVMRSVIEPAQVKKGVQMAVDCGNAHCRQTNEKTREHHIKSGVPGIDIENLSGANLTMRDQQLGITFGSGTLREFSSQKTAVDFTSPIKDCNGDIWCLATSLRK